MSDERTAGTKDAGKRKEVLYELFKDYEGADWLMHIESDPSPEAQKRMPELIEELKGYPMAPSNELSFLDDSTPAGVTREDIDAPHGLHLYHYEPQDKNPAEKRVIYHIHGGGFMRGNKWYCRFNAINQVKTLVFLSTLANIVTLPRINTPKALTM